MDAQQDRIATDVAEDICRRFVEIAERQLSLLFPVAGPDAVLAAATHVASNILVSMAGVMGQAVAPADRDAAIAAFVDAVGQHVQSQRPEIIRQLELAIELRRAAKRGAR